MHLKTALLFCTLLVAGSALAQQQQQQQQVLPGQSLPPSPQQTDPRATAEPENQPIKPRSGQQPQKKAADPKGTTRSMAFEVPGLVPIAEIPRGKVVTIQGVVLSPQPTTFVLNDGNSSQVIIIGPTWRDLTKVKPGDRVRVIGQMDPYGAPVFRAGSILLENNRIVVVPPAS